MPNQRFPLLGVVLAGGQSRRMGRSKARLPWGHGTLLSRAVACLLRVTPRVAVSARPRQRLPALPPGVLLVLDQRQDAGPCEGLFQALQTLDPEEAGVLLLPVDAAVSPALLRRLARRFAAGDSTVVLPKLAGRRLPLPGVYHRRLLPRAELAAQSQQGLRDLQACGNVAEVPVSAAEAEAFSMNTLAQYHRTRQRLEGSPDFTP